MLSAIFNVIYFDYQQALKEKELGNSAYKNKDFETALKHYAEAIKHDPTNMTYISNQAGKFTHVENLLPSKTLWYAKVPSTGPPL